MKIREAIEIGIYEKDKEIERLKEDNEYLNKVNIELSTLNTSLRSDRDKYKNIIKEVREYIEMHTPSDIGICGNKTKRYYTLGEDSVDHILEILDGESQV